ncbi:cytochrome b/b6 domain-containing protein [Loktanella sp. SALINAS62]|uniref:cytochrome b n=1 Tax=Loktanella sp. SALINAS62 TaxID=2706124 RepID=UPI001B8D9121|nr:cytochrome b/b6 domain-containing protein [Loktanella sp. SALINAS62]MBS1304014.1 hypothetical protein [Loktanella sp. SALINAS62]
MSDVQRYSRKHMVLHWVIALMVLAQFVLADGMSAAFGARMETATGGWTTGAIVHAVLGTSIGLLMLWRLCIRLTTQIPPPPTDAPAVIQKISSATHWAFYAILIGMPMAGALAWFYQARMIADLHEISAKALVVLVVLHICGSLYHHLIKGDRQVIRRMIPR